MAYLLRHWIDLANLLIAAVGVPALVYHVSGVHETIAVQNKQIKAQTLGTLYAHYFDVCRTLLAKPYLRPYVYDGRRIDETLRVDESRRAEVTIICELMTGLLEQAVVQRNNVPDDAWNNCWKRFLEEMYKDRDGEMARFYRANSHFYTAEFSGIVRALLDSKADRTIARTA